MGNNVPCPCNTTKEGVLVMKQDGTLLKFRKGVLASEVMVAHAGHRVVRCGSDRAVLPGSAEMESKRLYFLLPEALAESHEAYERFWRAGEKKGLVPPVKRKGSRGDAAAVPTPDRSAGGGWIGSSQVVVIEPSELKFPWAPRLKTIPESASPSPQAAVLMKAS